MSGMRQLTPLDAQFLNVESPTTVGHVGSLIVLDPSTAPGGVWNLDTVRAVSEPRLHLAPPLRQRLVEVPLGLGRPYWVDDPHFDIEFHLRELALPAPGIRPAARRAGRPDPRPPARPQPPAVGGLRHHRPRGRPGRVLLQDPPRRDRRRLRRRDPRDVMDLTVEPREVEPEARALRAAADCPSTVNLVRRGARRDGGSTRSRCCAPCRSAALPRPAARRGATSRGPRCSARPPRPVGRLARRRKRPEASASARSLKAPRTPLNGTITAHRRFAFGSVPLARRQDGQEPLRR